MDLEEAQMNVLLSRYHMFEKGKTQVLCLYPQLNLNEMDYFKVVVGGHLVKETKCEADQNPYVEHETSPSLKEGVPIKEAVVDEGSPLVNNSYKSAPDTQNFGFLLFYFHCTCSDNPLSHLKGDFIIVFTPF